MSQISSGADKKFHELNPLFTGYEHCRPGHFFGPAEREYYLLHYILEGEGFYWVEGKEYYLSAGESFLIKPGQITKYQADERNPWYYVWIGFNGMLAEDFRMLSPVLKISPVFFYEIRRAEEIEATRKEYLTGILFQIYSEIFSHKKQSRDYAKEVQEYIRYNYMSDITIEGLAKMVNVDRRYLSRIFKAKYGSSLKRYLMECRMDKAEEFLREGYKVASVAELVGYRDVCNFSKMFKQLKGKSPGYFKEGIE